MNVLSVDRTSMGIKSIHSLLRIHCLPSLLAAKNVSRERRLRFAPQNSILQSGQRALIGRSSKFILLAIVLEWHSQDKWSQRIRCKRHESTKDSHDSWNF